jgi:glycosyltransferase involved in cell wall biosynthesis
MKVTIITVSLNSEKTIVTTLNSVLNQSYKNIEHIIIDGCSTDATIKILRQYPFKNKKIFIKRSNIYEAMNEGIKKSTGDLIGILNSDDFYNNDKIIERLVKIVKKSKAKIFLGDVVYFNGNNYNKITRYYSAKTFNKNQFQYGLMPPHTGCFIKKEIYNKYGLYKENFLIASDFEILTRFILKNNIQTKILNFLVTRMKSGGISGKNIKAYLISSFEIVRSLKDNKIYSNFLKSIIRLPIKLQQFFFFNSKSLNKKFDLKINPFYKNILKSDFKIIQSIKKIEFTRNFILSGMNLAFLGYLVKGNIKKHTNLINWPDGIFSKIFGINIKKIPGREILKLLNIKKSKVNEIIVLGNLGVKQEKYLKKIYKKKITNIKLPYGNINEIKKKLNIKLNDKQVCFITLPTPKQEELAYHLAEKNKNFKIICIGASINIASGHEKSVPRIFSNLEFIWRLRYETFRRTKRLIETFIYFIYGRFISHKIRDLNVTIGK